MKQVILDDELKRLLGRAGYGLDTVLGEGETFALRSNANLSSGGYCVDVTDRIHPDNRDIAIRAAQAVGLDVAGIDFLTPDISQSYREVGGGVIEINYSPGLRPHVWPTEGEPRDVGGAILDTMFPPPGNQGRVPIALVAGRDSDLVAPILARILRSAGTAAGLVMKSGAFGAGESTGPEGAGRRGSNPGDAPRPAC